MRVSTDERGILLLGALLEHTRLDGGTVVAVIATFAHANIVPTSNQGIPHFLGGGLVIEDREVFVFAIHVGHDLAGLAVDDSEKAARDILIITVHSVSSS